MRHEGDHEGVPGFVCGVGNVEGAEGEETSPPA
jgi:hypothetical protein